MPFYLDEKMVESAKKWVMAADSIVITSHKNPDGDAIGSALGLFHVLNSFKSNVSVILPDAVPSFLQWMPEYERIVFFETQTQQAEELLLRADLVFNLDYNALHRTGEAMGAFLSKISKPSIMIDHHQQPEDFPVVLYSDTSACSTCEMVIRFVKSCGWGEYINSSASQCLYAGIVTDTGSFRFPSVSAETHEFVAELISNGLDHALVHRNIYDTNSLNRLRLVGYALSEKLEVWANLKTAVITLTQEELSRFSHQPGDTESLVNQALSIDGVQLAVFFREEKDRVKISFRSKEPFDVNQFARKGWNGGGHKNAAGGSTKESIEEALIRLKLELSNTIM